MKKKALYLAVPLALGLVACGGGGGTPATGPGFVSVMVTDAISTQYTKVWVTLTKVTVKDGSGAVIELFNDAAGKVINLTELKGVSNLLSTQSLAAGTYTDLTITLDPSVTLNDATATPITATLSVTDIVVTGTFTVSGGATSVGIDFDLANFTFDQATNTVTPTIVLRDHKTMQSLSQAYAELKGTIKSVPTNNLTDFVMTINNGAGVTADVTVTLLGNATVYVDANNGGAGVTIDNQVLRDRFVGKPVEVYGNYDPTALHIDAVRVRAASSSQNDSSVYGDYKLEGRAVAVLTPGQIQVDIREANFVPPKSLIIDVSNAKFDKGSASDFTGLSQTASLRVEMRGDWDPNTNPPTFTPKIVEIEGASRDRTAGTPTASIDDPYVEVRGQVQGSLSTDGASFKMSVLSKNHDDTSGDSSITQTTANTGVIDVDLSKGWFKSGKSACIKDKTYVEVKGSWTSQSVLDAHAIDVKNACSFSNESDNEIQDDSGQSNESTHHPEARGKITAIDTANSTLTMTVFRAKGLSGVQVGTGITVSFDPTTTLFDHGASGNLAANALIEVNGAPATSNTSPWDATTNTLTAGKIEFL